MFFPKRFWKENAWSSCLCSLFFQIPMFFTSFSDFTPGTSTKNKTNAVFTTSREMRDSATKLRAWFQTRRRGEKKMVALELDYRRGTSMAYTKEASAGYGSGGFSGICHLVIEHSHGKSLLNGGFYGKIIYKSAMAFMAMLVITRDWDAIFVTDQGYHRKISGWCYNGTCFSGLRQGGPKPNWSLVGAMGVFHVKEESRYLIIIRYIYIPYGSKQCLRRYKQASKF